MSHIPQTFESIKEQPNFDESKMSKLMSAKDGDRAKLQLESVANRRAGHRPNANFCQLNANYG